MMHRRTDEERIEKVGWQLKPEYGGRSERCSVRMSHVKERDGNGKLDTMLARITDAAACRCLTGNPYAGLTCVLLDNGEDFRLRLIHQSSEGKVDFIGKACYEHWTLPGDRR